MFDFFLLYLLQSIGFCILNFISSIIERWL